MPAVTTPLRLGFTLTLVVAAVLCVAAAADRGVLPPITYPAFTIEPLVAEQATEAYTVLTMFLPPSDGISPNVNVQRQPFPDGLDAYIALSEREFEGMGLTITRTERLGDRGVIYEVEGTLNDRSFRWYAKALLSDGVIHLATATATPEQWPQLGEQLKHCVDSLALPAVEP